MKINQILSKTYETNQEKNQYIYIYIYISVLVNMLSEYNRSVFNIENMQENHRISSIYIGFYIWSFYATIRHGCKTKNDRQ